MARRPIHPDVVAEVLIESRRRCCICFGLNRDTSICQGQIAHLDGKSSNSVKENLAFLCFNHHDKLDSSTRQSKNFTVLEVKRFRSELRDAIREAFSIPVTFGDAETSEKGELSGHYIRAGGVDSAEIKILRMKGNRYHVSGLALHGTDRAGGPNLGEIDFVAELDDGLLFIDSGFKPPYRLWLRVRDGKLVAEEENEFGYFGVGARFGGTYERA